MKKWNIVFLEEKICQFGSGYLEVLKIPMRIS